MRVLFVFFALVISMFEFQANAIDQRGFLIRTNFEYHGKNKTTKSESTFILDEKNRAWTTLVEPKEGMTLLGRLKSSDSKSLEIEYIVIDTGQKNAVISTPAIRALLGETAKMEVGETNGDKVLVSLLAQPTTYSTKK